MSLDRIEKIKCKLLFRDPWYGTWAAMMRWREYEPVKTMGVMVMSSGVVDSVYNKKFVDSISDEKLMCVLVHEIDHVVSLHCQRGLGKIHPIWNYATDMVVNGREDKPKILIYNSKTQQQECHLGHNSVWYDCKEDNLTAEAVYDLLKKNVIYIDISGNGGEGLKGEMVDNHDMWSKGTATEQDARSIVSGIVEQCSRVCGNHPEHLTEAIKALRDTATNWKRELSDWLGKQCGGKRPTFGRQNRRIEGFGIPGHTSRAMVDLSVFVDTSGSMGPEEIGEAFAQIEKLAWRAAIRLIEFDHGIEHVSRYRKGAWKKIVIHGRGGTSIIEALGEAEKRNLIGDVNVVITDGYLSWPEPKPYDLLWYIVSSSDELPTWGKLIRPNGRAVQVG